MFLCIHGRLVGADVLAQYSRHNAFVYNRCSDWGRADELRRLTDALRTIIGYVDDTFHGCLAVRRRGGIKGELLATAEQWTDLDWVKLALGLFHLVIWCHHD